MSTDELLDTLTETGSVTISNEIKIKKTDYGKYLVTALLPDRSSTKKLFYLEDKPTTSDMDAYKESVNTVKRWHSNDYDSVNGWEYFDLRDRVGSRMVQWKTSESR